MIKLQMLMMLNFMFEILNEILSPICALCWHDHLTRFKILFCIDNRLKIYSLLMLCFIQWRSIISKQSYMAKHIPVKS